MKLKFKLKKETTTESNSNQTKEEEKSSKWMAMHTAFSGIYLSIWTMAFGYLRDDISVIDRWLKM